MDRRDFLQKVLMTPVLAPLLLAAKRGSANDELFIIADRPQSFLNTILDDLHRYPVVRGKNFTFLTSHPQEKELRQILENRGSAYTEDPAQADMSLSFKLLHHAARPSFSLVQNNQTHDIRSHKLYALWKEMIRQNSFSRTLTIASFTKDSSPRISGETIAIYQSGKHIDRLPLSGQRTASYNTRSGSIIVKIEDGKARISSSPCRQHVCLLSPPVSLTGERIICAPNHFLLEVQGSGPLDTTIG